MPHILFIIIGGLIIGISSGLLGIGGGVVLVPFLLFICKLPMHQAVGSSLAIIIPTAICAGLVHYHNNNISVKIVLSLFVFTIIGGIIGAHLANVFPASVLKKIFAVFLMLIAVKMFLSS